MEYEDLIILHQEGKISFLEFLMEQKELAEEYQRDMQKRNEVPNDDNARKWLTEYENKHLYENEPEYFAAT